MQKVNSNSIAKLAAITASFALVAASLAIAPAAHAQSTSTTTTTTTTSGSAASAASLQAQIASLQAQLAASQGTMMMHMTFTRSLTIGSTGADVTALQSLLISKGFSIPAGATGYFGVQTRAAVAAYQSAHGISPAVGYFGPITRASVNSLDVTPPVVVTPPGVGCLPGAAFSSTTGLPCGTTTTIPPGSVHLNGGEGTINNFQTIGASNVTLGTGADQQIYGFSFMAGGSDLLVNRIYYDVANTVLTGTTRPWNIFGAATLKDASGAVVATVDGTNPANWSQDGTLSNGNQVYRLAFENVNTVVRMGTTQTYYLSLATQGAFATGNSGGIYSVGLAPQGLRATDAMGIQQYTSTAGQVSLVTVNNSSTGSVTLSVGSDLPQTTTLMANQNNTTQNVVLNTFTLNNTGSASLQLYTLPVTLLTAATSSGNTIASSSNLSGNLVQSLSLYQGSTLLDTESPSSTFTSGGTIIFKNIANVTIPSGTSQSFKVVANIQPVGGTNPAPAGAAVQVNVPGTGTDLETSNGAIITPNGTSTGYPISFAINGISIASAPTSATATAALASGGGGTAQTGTFTFIFNVTAFGQSVYVGSTTSSFVMNLVDTTTGSSTAVTNAALTSSANRSPGGNFLVNSGQTVTFTVTAQKTSGSGHFFYATLNSLSYGTSDSTTGSTTVALPSSYTTNAVAIAS
ncbi:peptidoglycan-binding protein [Patescibacteria group bacterium]|nr:peptidoglycan-binding protein [Patescibacteria group bacterium]